MQRLLLRLFGLATFDIARVAQALADGLLEDYAPDVLDPLPTQQYLRTQYMRLVNRYGLPAGICNDVAGQAWGIIAQLRESDTDAATSAKFAFYD